MTVGIVGLGLIGGSFAKAYHEAGATVLAWNRSRSVLDFCHDERRGGRRAHGGQHRRVRPRAHCALPGGDHRLVPPHGSAHRSAPRRARLRRHEAHHLRRVLPDRKRSTVLRSSAVTRWPVRSTPASRTRKRPCIMARRWSSCRRTLTTCCSLTVSSSCSSPRASRASRLQRRRRTTR